MSGFFDDDRVMFVPLSVDNTETDKQGYFFSNKKVIEMVVMLIPLGVMLTALLRSGAGLLPIGIVIGIYAVIYILFLRFRIFEEPRLRRDLNELDANRYSGVDHFWGITKIGTEGEMRGIINYEMTNNRGKELGLVVSYDRGSTVGVPKGHFATYRQTKMNFLREISKQGFDFRWYEIPSRSELPPTLINYMNMMVNIDNPSLKNLIKLQLDINTLFVMESDVQLKDYILITNNKLKTLRNFRTIVQSIIESTLDGNVYMQNPHILDKHELNDFFADVLFIDSMDSDLVRRGVTGADFSKFAQISRIIDDNGREVVVDLEEDEDIELLSADKSSLDADIERENVMREGKRKDIERRRKIDKEKITRKRVQDKMTNEEFKEAMAVIDSEYDRELQQLEQYGSNYKAILRQQELDRRKRERELDTVTAEELLEQDTFIEDSADVEIRAGSSFKVPTPQTSEPRKKVEPVVSGFDFDDDDDEGEVFLIDLDGLDRRGVGSKQEDLGFVYLDDDDDDEEI